ncbi:MAG TPA: hypothetical protein VIL46_16530, partial [Gemmataceae bacterium]
LLWDPAAGKVLRELVDPDPVRIYGMAFTPDRKQLLTTHHADDADLGEARVWDVAAGKRLRSFPLPAFSATGHPAFSPDGKTLVFAASEPAVVLWDFATGKPRLAPPGHRREVLNLAFTPDGRTLVTGSADSVRAWDVATGKPLRALAEAARWMSPRFVPAGPGSVLLAGAPRREPVLLDIKTGEARARLPTAGEEKSRVAVLALAADGRTAVGISGTPDGRTHRLHVWDVAEGKEVESRLLRDDEPHDALLAGGDWLAGTARVARPSLEKSEKGDPADRAPVRLIVQDRKDGRPRMRATLPGAWGFAVAEVPGGYALATASGELKGTDTGNRLARSALHVWEIATGTPRLEIVREGGESDADLSDPAVSPDGRTLAAVWGERTVEIFDAWTGKELRTLRSDARVLELAFSPDGALLAAGLADGGVLIWDVAAVTRRGHPARQLSEAEAAACWDRLAADAKSAHAAAADLLGDPGRAVALLRGRLKPAAAVPEETVRGLIADLGSPRFARREEAARRLGALGDRAEPALRAAVAESPSGEVRERAGRLLDGSWRLADAEALRRLRAAEVLERLGTAEARALLRELASGDPRARETRAAQRALRRASP